MEKRNFTEGKILTQLLLFAMPVLFALFLQSLYGAVDLMIVGKFAQSADVSGVSTGSQIMMTLTNCISAMSMGVTVFLGQKIGEKREDEGGMIVANGIILFLTVGLVMSLLIPANAGLLAGIMHAPEEAFAVTEAYIRICGAGTAVIIAYNLIGSIFRGIGDSVTPLLTVAVACACNIAGDLFLVGKMGMGAKGAAAATVFAQLVSVAVSMLMIRGKKLPIALSKESFRPNRKYIGKIVYIGAPVALQDFLVGISFLVILAIVNSLGLIESAGVGVAEKVCGFIMLIPSAFAQAMSAFVAQNRGAKKYGRAFLALRYAIAVSFCFGVCMFVLAFFGGDILSGLFANDREVIAASAEYLKAYAIDCLLTCFLFCFIGFFNGMEYTRFVMLQGIAGAFFVRIPVSFIMSRVGPVSLFRIGLATPCSTLVQIALCFGCLRKLRRGLKEQTERA